MNARGKSRRPRPPLTPASLEELALRYVGRFSTTRAKLRQYLTRKVRERGWDGTAAPDLDALVGTFAARGYVDDAAFATAKARSLSARGYGPNRLRQSLGAAGVEEEDASGARAIASEEAAEAALRFARRRRLGPFADGEIDRAAREKALAAMLRAGHGMELARKILALPPGGDPSELATGLLD